MFGEEFYPTPKHIIKRMIDPHLENLKKERKFIGDMSAGKGDILDYLRKSFSEYAVQHRYLAIEKNPELRMILQEKRYTVIGDDFLKYNNTIHFDYLFLNPPFSNGDEHLLKAWEIIKNGVIVCLLNSETIHNPYTKRRHLLVNIIQEHGKTEELGPCFDTAERKTNVNVTMVTLYKETDAHRFDFFEDMDAATEQFDFDGEEVSTEVMLEKPDIVETMVRLHGSVIELFAQYLTLRNKMQFYAEGVLRNHKNIDDIINEAKNYSLRDEETFNEFIHLFKMECWENLFRITNFEKIMTQGVKKDFRLFCQQQGTLDFTEENIKNLLHSLIVSSKDILQNALLDVFDTMTKYDKKNKVHVEGWKTNDAWKVNRKVILPNCISYMNYGNWDSDHFRIDYGEEQFLHDIDKVMCNIAGKKIESITTIAQALNQKFTILGRVGKGPFNNTCHSTFFDMRFFKKRTLHLYFRDEYLWQTFNIRAAQGKGWLPHDYDKSTC